MAFCVFTTSVSRADAPPWSNPTVKRVDSTTVVVNCDGFGISPDLAYRDAVQKCSAIAANEKNSEFTSKQLVVETNESASFYSEVASNKKVSGLAGDTIQEKTDKTDTGFSTWLQIKFDLSKAEVVSVDEPPEPIVDVGVTKKLIDKSPLKPTSSPVPERRLVQGNDRTWVVTTTPKCQSILIKSARPRTITCNSNVMTITVNSVADTELIFTPPPGYLPKILKVPNGRLPASYETNSVEVFFDAK